MKTVDHDVGHHVREVFAEALALDVHEAGNKINMDQPISSIDGITDPEDLDFVQKRFAEKSNTAIEFVPRPKMEETPSQYAQRLNLKNPKNMKQVLERQVIDGKQRLRKLE